MIKVVLISETLNKLNFYFAPVEFPESPLIGDFINILDFAVADAKTELEKSLKENNLIQFGEVVGRNWGTNETSVLLSVLLEFEQTKDSQNEMNNLENIANLI